MCTRALIKYEDVTFTARTMDWHLAFDTRLVALPKGVKRKYLPNQEKSWTSKYNSLSICEVFPIPNQSDKYLFGPGEGINEAGLAVNILWLAESSYDVGDTKETVNLSSGLWGQFMLDNYKDVEEAVKDWSAKKYRLTTVTMPGEPTNKATAHMCLSDSKGNSAVLEFYKPEGEDLPKLHITTNLTNIKSTDYCNVEVHHTSVVTNSPTYQQQIKLNYYWEWQWKEFHGDFKSYRKLQLQSIPGTTSAQDRFARASFYLNHINKASAPTSYQHQVAQGFSLMKTVTAPINYKPTSQGPNISNTLWTTVTDNTNAIVFYQSSYVPTTFMCKLRDMKFKDIDTAYVYNVEDGKLPLEAGDITHKFTEVNINNYQFVAG